MNINHSILKEYFPNWFEILFKPEYLKILYQLAKNKFCHAKGLVKLFHENVNTCMYRLNNLSKYRIIEVVRDKEKYENILYKHRKVFRLDAYHFEKAEWYKLTKLGKQFYSSLDYSFSLHPLIIEQVDNYTEALRKTTDVVHREIKLSKDFIEHILPKYKIKLEDQSDTYPLNWAEGVIHTHFRKTGVVLDITAEELLNKLNERLIS